MGSEFPIRTVNDSHRLSSGTIGTAIRLRADLSYELPSDCRGDSEFVTIIRRIIRVVTDMIGTILDACREVLEINGAPQSAYWLASQMMEMRMWRAANTMSGRHSTGTSARTENGRYS